MIKFAITVYHKGGAITRATAICGSSDDAMNIAWAILGEAEGAVSCRPI